MKLFLLLQATLLVFMANAMEVQKKVVTSHKIADQQELARKKQLDSAAVSGDVEEYMQTSARYFENAQISLEDEALIFAKRYRHADMFKKILQSFTLKRAIEAGNKDLICVLVKLGGQLDTEHWQWAKKLIKEQGYEIWNWLIENFEASFLVYADDLNTSMDKLTFSNFIHSIKDKE